MSDRASWPKLMDELAGLIGEELTLELVRVEGGLRTRIPREVKPRQEHPWRMVIRDDNAWATIVRAYGGTYLDLPRGTFVGVVPAKVLILELAEQGLSRREIARQAKVTERHVRRLLNGVGGLPDPRQEELRFDR